MTTTDMTIRPPADAAAGKPWGVWTSIAWVVVAVGFQLLFLFWIIHSPLLRSIGPVLYFLLWAISPVVLVVAVVIRHLSVPSYMAWTVPSPGDVIVAIGGALVVCFGFGVLFYVVSGGTSIVGVNIADAYRHYLAAGGTPSRYLLKDYQAYLYAPLVEETVFRGFLWRGLAASRLGNGGAWLLTSVLFVASHVLDYTNPGGLMDVAAGGLILGLVRWRTGSATASMITHSLYNLWGDVGGAMLTVAIGWP
jgi:uncharacterized protein